MCGIVGVFEPSRAGDPDLVALARRMGRAISHRGPDSSGEWTDPDAGFAVSHQRLAIIDLSPGGAQPMVSGCGRYVLAFNGEIYNFRQLRQELERSSAIAWRGESDTEVLLEAIARWGLESALQRSCGMFAFALWDRDRRALTLARDRLGQKPLYFGWIGAGSFVFASELGALLPHPDFTATIDRRALASYLQGSCVPAPASIYEGIHKLEPASFLTIDAEAVGHRAHRDELAAMVRRYWSIEDVAAAGAAEPVSEGEALTSLEELIGSAVSSRLVSDVPLGAFLSGGIDSSLVVAFMQSSSASRTRTFSIGFREDQYDESPFAEAVARHLGTEHTTFEVTATDALATIEDLPRIYDEPFADSSQIPTVLVSRLAREHVTVALSGDGGDESFGGYLRYRANARLWSRLARLPRPLRSGLARCTTGMPPGLVASAIRLAAGRPIEPARIAALLDSVDRASFYRQRNQCIHDPARFLVDPRLPVRRNTARLPAGLDFRQWMMLEDTSSYLPDDILVKVDRASMSVGLEARCPLLDHRVVEYAARMPVDIKFRDGKLKWPLRQLLERRIPSELIDRPKRGFAVPIGHWLKRELRDWAEALLDPARIDREGHFEPAEVSRLWRQHLDGVPALHSQLWTVLMFQSWYERARELAGDARRIAR